MTDSPTPSPSREALDEKALDAAQARADGIVASYLSRYQVQQIVLAYLVEVSLPASILEIVSEVKRLDKEWRELRNPLTTSPSVGGARERWLQWQLANVCIQLAEFIQRTTETRGT